MSLGVQCRFTPTCSEYAQEAIEVHGPYGIVLASGRLLRCHPLCKGGLDPVPFAVGKQEHRHG
ncbi:MAG: membrane protein insertion efficiency factor YidD [Bacteriovoracia bacterium]